MTEIAEIAADTFRLSTFIEPAGLGFSEFLIRDTQPVLYETGQNAIFTDVFAAVKKLVDPAKLRWVGFSHFEADESSALARWLDAAPNAAPITSALGAATNVRDVTARAAKVLGDNEELVTGIHRLRFLVTPYVPHSWDATLLFDETTRTLFCSDPFAQHGAVPAMDAGERVLTRALDGFGAAQNGPFRESIPYTSRTAETFCRLAALQPRVLAILHGSCVEGDRCGELLTRLADGLAGIYGVRPKSAAARTGAPC